MTAAKMQVAESPWSHRLAWLLAINVFLLICMGGTVTTCESGMAVPDWPTTYSYWWYPVQMWTTVWDVFLEHGHRLLAQLAGLTSITLAILLWRTDPRGWMRWIAVLIVLGVVVQGTLGGIRVLADNRLLARIHGCIAPLYFALCTAVIAWTSKSWRTPAAKPTSDSPGVTACLQAVPLNDQEHANQASSLRWSWFLVAAIYVEIVIGAILRRPSSDTMYGSATFWVWLKVLNAALIAAIALLLLIRAGQWKAKNRSPESSGFARRAWLLGGILFVQLVLAAFLWLANYGWPDWVARWFGTLPYTITAQGRLQVFVTSAHAAIGSLTLVLAANLVLWLKRFGHSLTKALRRTGYRATASARLG